MIPWPIFYTRYFYLLVFLVNPGSLTAIRNIADSWSRPPDSGQTLIWSSAPELDWHACHKKVASVVNDTDSTFLSQASIKMNKCIFYFKIDLWSNHMFYGLTSEIIRTDNPFPLQDFPLVFLLKFHDEVGPISFRHPIEFSTYCMTHWIDQGTVVSAGFCWGRTVRISSI